MKAEPISAEVMDVAASIEKDIPSRITGQNRVFIRAVIARAITAAVAAEREACFQAISTANLRLGGIETTLMHGDNLAVTLCTHFDDGADSDDDTGWSPSAIAGYQEVTDAICEHYTAAIRARSES